jgi:hypothetical protein
MKSEDDTALDMKDYIIIRKTDICTAVTFLTVFFGTRTGGYVIPSLMSIFIFQFVIFLAPILFSKSLKGKRIWAVAIYFLSLFLVWKFLFFEFGKKYASKLPPSEANFLFYAFLIGVPGIVVLCIYCFLKGKLSNMSNEQKEERHEEESDEKILL